LRLRLRGRRTLTIYDLRFQNDADEKATRRILAIVIVLLATLHLLAWLLVFT
jgi:hypothetical protein